MCFENLMMEWVCEYRNHGRKARSQCRRTYILYRIMNGYFSGDSHISHMPVRLRIKRFIPIPVFIRKPRSSSFQEHQNPPSCVPCHAHSTSSPTQHRCLSSTLLGRPSHRMMPYKPFGGSSAIPLAYSTLCLGAPHERDRNAPF